MTDFDKLIAGGDSGDPAIVSNDLEKSHMVELITPEKGEAEMPQKADPLHETEINLIKKWISEGKINCKEDMQEGFENAPKTLRRLFESKNKGKQLLRIAD